LWLENAFWAFSFRDQARGRGGQKALFRMGAIAARSCAPADLSPTSPLSSFPLLLLY